MIVRKFSESKAYEAPNHRAYSSLRLFGMDHLRLTHRYQGRDFRLTDVGGKVVEKLLA